MLLNEPLVEFPDYDDDGISIDDLLIWLESII